MNFADYKKRRQNALRERAAMERRPTLTTQEERFLYSLRLKTMEYRTLMATLKDKLSRSDLDEILVEYNLRLRKARTNFDEHNYKMEWDVEK